MLCGEKFAWNTLSLALIVRSLFRDEMPENPDKRRRHRENCRRAADRFAPATGIRIRSDWPPGRIVRHGTALSAAGKRSVGFCRHFRLSLIPIRWTPTPLSILTITGFIITDLRLNSGG
jgi:hypothetical protein